MNLQNILKDEHVFENLQYKSIGDMKCKRNQYHNNLFNCSLWDIFIHITFGITHHNTYFCMTSSS